MTIFDQFNQTISEFDIACERFKESYKTTMATIQDCRKAIRENHMVVMPTKLPRKEEAYLELEGIKHGDKYYHILYEATVRTIHDYDLQIVQVSSAPIVETGPGDDTYKIMRKVDKEMHDWLLNYVDKYFFDNEMDDIIQDMCLDEDPNISEPMIRSVIEEFIEN